MIIIIMFYREWESLNLCNFSLELSKMFYLQTVQTNIIHAFLWKDVVKVTPKLDLSHGFVPRELKFRIIVINFQIVNQIFRIQQHCRMTMALETYRGVLNWTSNENTYKQKCQFPE